MVSRIIPVERFDLIIFGGTGDLARRKILPGLFKRFADGQVPDGSRIIGAARSEMDRGEFRQFAKDAVISAQGDAVEPTVLESFLEALDYVTIDALGEIGWSELSEKLQGDSVRAFYFSVGPSLFDDLAVRLQKHKLVEPDTRIVVEKPFGHDLETAKALNKVLSAYFDESQIYRIDHYLGKETVQNLMAVRFGNMLFEPLWNSQYIDHVQITVAEEVGVGGRGGYYDKSGAMRDMVQNHLMQLLCLTAMEPPAKFDPDAVRDEKLKVIRALDPVEPHHVVRGQYSETDDEKGFRDDVENAKSWTESFVALRCQVGNWRWSGTPFYLRTGKRLQARDSEIVVVFKDTPHSIFGAEAGGARNELRIQLQPDEGITLKVTIKEPGPGGMRLMDVPLDMSFAETLGDHADTPDAYERLIMDVIRGNQTLFMRDDEVEAAWAWTDPIIQGWEAVHDVPKPYDSYSQGPTDAMLLMQRDGREWREIGA
ncbi:glucose-6-phosphate dehydrogenase [Cognatishimia activa]|uniref:Glucose-6-phosphate 1-dehydrogenase n=1 Tax=Cognatishimia activa TaxID=1715691 RepID=A0A0P1IP31_9RHOB|nr:glucose-6-phosphate dehydrogenase [Cognatishimia activa]CUJ27098.1 Glucose-6-phosphate 1-dehydrogenase [Cognatishimia activa]CUK25290.1 Glucose-6-phosphate 1-dehydrogenase [Cognatishimia activa]